MPSTLRKTKKQIAKKRGGEVNALHEKSRNAMRLHKAGVRDQRLEALAAARGKKEQPIADRVAYFQQGLLDKGCTVLDIAAIQELIHSFVHQYDEELDQLKKARRSGRPASVRQDLLQMKISSLEEEYKNGFLLPDVTTEDNVQLLGQWEGSWSYLATIPWIRVSAAGNLRKAELPAKGLS
ncbi:Translation machinery-associated protein 16 [Escovopsis weberi]|uniref:Translation machinery-associated protein 16 n=1 Tax=Escovopsis weberi TaxID=150374 RepID=A0A0M8N215_ESCWE|nr:Translation machinery-associated protein 16 [Escovopsis weberi]